MAKADKRFLTIFDEASSIDTSFSIIVDTKTAVNYILVERSISGVALTPLLDGNGNVVKSSKEEIKDLRQAKK